MIKKIKISSIKNNNKIKMFNNNHKKNQNTHVKNIYIFYFK